MRAASRASDRDSDKTVSHGTRNASQQVEAARVTSEHTFAAKQGASARSPFSIHESLRVLSNFLRFYNQSSNGSIAVPTRLHAAQVVQLHIL